MGWRASIDSPRMPVEEYSLRLQSIRFRTNMGASKSERSIPQEIIVDVELTLPVSALPKRDLRRDAVDYGVIADLVVEEGLAEPYHLLETYAQRLVTRLLETTPAIRVRVGATKLRVPTSHSVDRAVVELVATR
jgi:7,8-dihydroneopterin aldolase/epimerase/oxygenase